MNENPFFHRLECLVFRLTSRCTEDQLALQAPIQRDIPFFGNALIDERVVVLQICTKTFSVQSRPDCSFVSSVHSIGVWKEGATWQP